MGSFLYHDKELTACRIGHHGPSHGQHAAVMSQIVLEAVLSELALDGVAGAAHTSSVGTAALDHKAGDHPVEDQAVIIALLDQADKVVDRVGRRLGIELRLDDAAVLHLNSDNGVLCHEEALLSITARGRSPDDQYRPLDFIVRSISRLASRLAADSRLS